MPLDVIMPALGMAQDSGLVVAWHKAPGEAVAAGDALFEVETDKATMEVEAGHDGYVAALLVDAGQTAPVGSVIAVISTEKPGEAAVQRPAAASAAPDPAPCAPKPRASDARPETATRTVPARSGSVLASPKARRLAAERGLDLARLAEAGRPQPYHVADLAALTRADAPAGQASPLHLTARADAAPLAAFLDWLEESADRPAVLAAFALAALRTTPEPVLDVRVESAGPGSAATFADPDLVPLSAIAPGAAEDPALILRDLAGSRITGAALGPPPAPVLTLTQDGGTLVVTLDCDAGHLAPDAAIALIDGFTERLDMPVRHLF